MNRIPILRQVLIQKLQSPFDLRTWLPQLLHHERILRYQALLHNVLEPFCQLEHHLPPRLQELFHLLLHALWLDWVVNRRDVIWFPPGERIVHHRVVEQTCKLIMPRVCSRSHLRHSHWNRDRLEYPVSTLASTLMYKKEEANFSIRQKDVPRPIKYSIHRQYRRHCCFFHS